MKQFPKQVDVFTSFLGITFLDKIVGKTMIEYKKSTHQTLALHAVVDPPMSAVVSESRNILMRTRQCLVTLGTAASVCVGHVAVARNWLTRGVSAVTRALVASICPLTSIHILLAV